MNAAGSRVLLKLSMCLRDTCQPFKTSVHCLPPASQRHTVVNAVCSPWTAVVTRTRAWAKMIFKQKDETAFPTRLYRPV